ncbi:bidirectional sugar transporter NEC1-like isoform X2 [Salvia miltiorrhiza]|uniref:bidirectional sugar transporter NEC1-like isoform X2 n=1 Tax=Salvia miltiorrhiza TaxID=226208 RepID=UPI0025AC135A|nr:bidirectional sugar transporter NEC1-like isoform X2 [Salvia miltiorrhiza]
MAFLSADKLAIIFGLLGNIISFLVFLAPLPTFYRICRKKSSEGFQSIPYSISFFSASLLLYYAYLKTNAYMIVSINGIGCAIEALYIFLYIVYAPKKVKIFTMRWIVLFNGGGLGVIMLVSLLAVKGSKRVALVGWVCAIINIAVFAAPLSVMLPNILGLLLGVTQMILYFIYKDKTKRVQVIEDSISKSEKDIEMNINFDKSVENEKKVGDTNYELEENASNLKKDIEMKMNFDEEIKNISTNGK